MTEIVEEVMLDLACPSCRRLLRIADTSIDQESQCPACRTVFLPGRQLRGNCSQSDGVSETSVTQDTPPSRFTEETDEEITPDDQRADYFISRSVPPPEHSQLATNLRRASLGFVAGCATGLLMYFRLESLHLSQNFADVFWIGLWAAIWTGLYSFVITISKPGLYRWLAYLCVAGAMAFFFLVYMMMFFVTPHEHALDAAHAMACTVPPMAMCCHLILALVLRVGEELCGIASGFKKAAGRSRPLGKAPADVPQLETDGEDFQ